MMDESMDKDQLSKPPQPWEFRSKPAWQRLLIMLGGVAVNFLLGFLIYMMVLFVWGTEDINLNTIKENMNPAPEMEVFGFQKGDKVLEVDGQTVNIAHINKTILLRDIKTIKVRRLDGNQEVIAIPDTIGNYIVNRGFLPFMFRLPPVIEDVIKNSPASSVGMDSGTIIRAINGTPVESRYDVVTLVGNAQSDSLLVKFVSKLGEQEKILVLNKEKKMGVYFKNPEMSKKEYSFGESISKGLGYGYWTIHDYLAQLKYIFTTKKGITGVGGFATIEGKIKAIFEEKTFGSDGNFRKRETVLTTVDDQYPQSILIEFVQDRCALLDQVQVGDLVKINIQIRGREWTNPEGQVRYFNSIQGWRIEKVQVQQVGIPPSGNAEGAMPSSSFYPSATSDNSSENSNEGPDDLPF
ncbi:zinc metalloprotease [Elysia marginata]|uniref:Zinc metalloprotease n=1 Tax=Elysia marginata TaxID=1093978 RepID=A0AAV4FVK6_9GAST|nr:zinc metalloprotease [Elysia marginata]